MPGPLRRAQIQGRRNEATELKSQLRCGTAREQALWDKNAVDEPLLMGQ
jgi:hypothetical protein